MFKHLLIIITLCMIWLAVIFTVGPATSGADPTPTAAVLPTPVPFELGPEWEPYAPAPSPAKHQIFAETEHFIIYSPDDYLPLPLEAVVAWAEEGYKYVAEQLETGIDQRIYLNFMPPLTTDCYPRGYFALAVDEDDAFVPVVTVLADEETSPAQIKGAVAHETAHAIHALGFKHGLSAESGLDEGLATWASRDYWVDWMEGESLEEMVRGYREDDVYRSLVEWFSSYTHPRNTDCIEQRNIIYTELASFTGWLIDEYGMETFIDLMDTASESRVDNQLIRTHADFEAVYGMALNQLEAAWLEWVSFQ